MMLAYVLVGLGVFGVGLWAGAAWYVMPELRDIRPGLWIALALGMLAFGGAFWAAS